MVSALAEKVERVFHSSCWPGMKNPFNFSAKEAHCNSGTLLTISNHAVVIAAIPTAWFEIVSSVPELQCASFEIIQHVANCINSSEVIGNSERTQLQVSFESFCADMDINSEIQEREAAAIDGDIVTDNEIDDADSIQRADIPFDPSLKTLIQKRACYINSTHSKQKRPREC